MTNLINVCFLISCLGLFYLAMAEKNDGTYRRQPILTDKAPKPIGSYSQAIVADGQYKSVYLSGSIPLNEKNELVTENLEAQVRQVFINMGNVAEAAGGSLANVVKVNIYLTNLDDMAVVNKVMPYYFNKPFPARTTIGVAALPMNVPIEAEAIMRI